MRALAPLLRGLPILYLFFQDRRELGWVHCSRAVVVAFRSLVRTAVCLQFLIRLLFSLRLQLPLCFGGKDGWRSRQPFVDPVVDPVVEVVHSAPIGILDRF